MTGEFDSLLFDFDGVLADSEQAHFGTWNAVLEQYGIEFTWERYQRECIGIADVMVARMLHLPDEKGAVARKQALLRKALAENPPFSEETQALIRELTGTYRMAVVSSSYHSEVDPPLRNAGLYECFEHVVCGDDVERLKPAPDLYLLASRKMDVRKPLVVEDSEAGVAAGVAAGFEVLRVTVASMAQQVREKLTTR